MLSLSKHRRDFWEASFALRASVTWPAVKIEAATIEIAVRSVQLQQGGKAWGDINSFDRGRLFEARQAAPPEQHRHAAIIVPRAAMRRDIAFAGYGNGHDGAIQQHDDIARSLGIKGSAGAVLEAPVSG
jgi:hypothetical protein